MYFVLVLLLSLVLALMDGSLASCAILFPFLVISNYFITSMRHVEISERRKFWLIISTSYILLAYIFSFSFENGNFFLVFDPSHYLLDYQSARNFHLQGIITELYENYINLSDNNVLYNILLVNVAAIGSLMGGSTVFSMTVLQTGFGILTCCLLYKVLSRYTSRAYFFSIQYAFFGFLCFYSNVIIRDIIIAFFYLWAINVLLKDFSIGGAVQLLICIFVTLGLRLYSGLFMFVFLVYYFYAKYYNLGLRNIATILAIIVGVVSLGPILSSVVLGQTENELSIYAELSATNSNGGMLSRLQQLPPVISQIAILFFSMIKPIPPFAAFSGLSSFSNFIMSSLFTLSFWWWYIIFYITIIGIVLRKYWKSLSHNELFLLLITFLFLLGNTAHPDIRRMMPMFPILYICYIRVKDDKVSAAWINNDKKLLIVFYVILGLISSIR